MESLSLPQAYRKIPSEVRDGFIGAANHVLSNVFFKAWTPEAMRACWRKRSLSQIEDAGEINHLFPCIDAAALATAHLSKKHHLSARLKLLTEKGAVAAFRNGTSHALHLDALVEISHEKDRYGMNIGCGDVVLYKPLPLDSSAQIGSEEIQYLTTRPEDHERVWRRTPLCSISGRVLTNHRAIPLLNFVHSAYNRLRVPYDITREDFHAAPSVAGRPSILDTNQDYDPLNSAKDNASWLEENRSFLPGLGAYCYR